MNYKTYEVRVYENGNKCWYLNDRLHRENAPAIELSSGYREWWLNGKLHRDDGPAIEKANGYKEWYLNGVVYLEGEWKKKVNQLKNTYNGRLVEIDGKKYKLVEVN